MSNFLAPALRTYNVLFTVFSPFHVRKIILPMQQKSTRKNVERNGNGKGMQYFNFNFFIFLFLIAQVMLITHDRCVIDEIRVIW